MPSVLTRAVAKEDCYVRIDDRTGLDRSNNLASFFELLDERTIEHNFPAVVAQVQDTVAGIEQFTKYGGFINDQIVFFFEQVLNVAFEVELMLHISMPAPLSAGRVVFRLTCTEKVFYTQVDDWVETWPQYGRDAGLVSWGRRKDAQVDAGACCCDFLLGSGWLLVL